MPTAVNVTVCHDKEVGEREENYLCTELPGRPRKEVDSRGAGGERYPGGYSEILKSPNP